MAGSADVTAEQCGFFDYPQAFSAAGESNGGLECGLIHCSILLGSNTYTGTTQVVLSGPEAFVESCEFFTNAGPQGCTAISVGSGAVGCRIEGCHLSDFSNGIAVGAGARFTRISNCKVDALAGLTIAPATDNGTIYGVFVTACSFGMLENTTTSSATWGIYIDTAEGSNTNVEGICIVACMAYGYQDAGLQINRGQSISVIGGKYSSNGQHPGSSELGAGIAITGPCADVRIVGADCSGVFDFWPTVETSPLPVKQPYGISVASGVTDVIANACNLTNNATAALYVPTNGTDLRVTDCMGYNDQATPVRSTAPGNGVIFGGATYGYYGPVAFYVSGGTVSTIYVDEIVTGLTQGGFTLSPGEESAAIFYSVAPNFTMVGK